MARAASHGLQPGRCGGGQAADPTSPAWVWLGSGDVPQPHPLEHRRQHQGVELTPAEPPSTSGGCFAELRQRVSEPSAERLMAGDSFSSERMVEVVYQRQPRWILLEPCQTGLDDAGRGARQRACPDRPAHGLDEIGDERLVYPCGDGGLSADEVGDTPDCGFCAPRDHLHRGSIVAPLDKQGACSVDDDGSFGFGGWAHRGHAAI